MLVMYVASVASEAIHTQRPDELLISLLATMSVSAGSRIQIHADKQRQSGKQRYKTCCLMLCFAHQFPGPDSCSLQARPKVSSGEGRSQTDISREINIPVTLKARLIPTRDHRIRDHSFFSAVLALFQSRRTEQKQMFLHSAGDDSEDCGYNNR